MLELALQQWPWIEHLGWALLHSLWQICLIGLIYFAVHRLMARSTPAARIWLGESALVACLLVPILTVVGSESPAHTAMAFAGEGTQQVVRALQASSSLDWLTEILTGVALCWMAGVMLLATRAAWKWQSLQQLVSRAQDIPAEWQGRWAEILRDAELRRPVRWLESAEVAGPMLVGWLKPVILFPIGLATRLPAAQVELLLEHELAHIRRADFLFNALQLVVETLLFFHPVVHWIARSVRHDRELACDERVAHRHPDRITYARALLSAAEVHREHSALGLAASGGHLLDRVRRLVGEPSMQDPRESLLRALPMTVALIALMAALRMAPIAPLWEKLPVADLVTDSIRSMKATLFDLDVDDLATADKLPIGALLPTAIDLSTEQGLSVDDLAPLPLPPLSLTAQDAAQPIAVEVASLDPLALSPLSRSQQSGTQLERGDWFAPLHAPAPAYPLTAQRSSVEGYAELSFLVDSNGHVYDIQVESSNPKSMFEGPARRALEQWRFQSNYPSAERRVQRFDFTLSYAVESTNDPRVCVMPTGSRLCSRSKP